MRPFRMIPAALAVALAGLLPAGAGAQIGFSGAPWANPFFRSQPLPAFGNPYAFRSVGPAQIVSVYTPNGFQMGFIGPQGPFVPQFLTPPAMQDQTAGIDLRTGLPLWDRAVATAGLGMAVAADAAANGQQPAASKGSVKVNGNKVDITVKRDRYGRAPVARASETVEAKIEKDNRLAISWSGDAANVARIRFILLDKDRKPIKEETFARAPATARFTLTNKTAFYQVQVEYVNGTTSTVTSPI